MKNNDALNYNAIPYESLPFEDTSPDRLSSLGLLFGLSPANPVCCQMLEIGCAMGGNLIPLAYFNPQSHFIGLDISSEQIRFASELAENLNLKNIEFICTDLKDFTSDTRFDFIVAHGVFSWVSEDIRQAMFALVNRFLAADGLAYISYNTLPGWRMREALRDMLLYQVRDTESPAARLKSALKLLEKLCNAMMESQDPMIEVVRNEITRLKNSHPSYVYHEFLADNNEGLFFNDVVSMAQTNGLAYVCDIDLRDSLKETHDSATDTMSEPISKVEQAQFLDFVHVRSYRQSIFCRQEKNPAHALNLSSLQNISICADVVTPAESKMHGDATQNFVNAQGEVFAVNSPLMKISLAILAQIYPDAISCQTLYEAARYELGNSDDQQDYYYQEISTLIANNIINITCIDEFPPLNRMSKPNMSSLASLEAKNGFHVSTRRHKILHIDEFARDLIQYINGENDVHDIINALIQDVQEDRLRLDIEGIDGQQIAMLVKANVERLLQTFSRHGLLVE